MGAHNRDILAAPRANSCVHAARRYAVGIIDDLQPRMVPRNPFQNLARTVVRHAVGDDDLESTRRWLLSQNRSDTIFDVIAFVTTGDHDRYRGSGIVISGHV